MIGYEALWLSKPFIRSTIHTKVCMRTIISTFTNLTARSTQRTKKRYYISTLCFPFSIFCLLYRSNSAVLSLYICIYMYYFCLSLILPVCKNMNLNSVRAGHFSINSCRKKTCPCTLRKRYACDSMTYESRYFPKFQKQSNMYGGLWVICSFVPHEEKNIIHQHLVHSMWNNKLILNTGWN